MFELLLNNYWDSGIRTELDTLLKISYHFESFFSNAVLCFYLACGDISPPAKVKLPPSEISRKRTKI